MATVWRFWKNAFGGSVTALAFGLLAGFAWTLVSDRNDRRAVHDALLPDVLAVVQRQEHVPLSHPETARAFASSVQRLLPGERTDADADAQALRAMAAMTNGTSGAFMRRFSAPPREDERLLLHTSGLSRQALAAELAFLRVQRWDTDGTDALLTTYSDLLARAMQVPAEPVVAPPLSFPLVSPAAVVVIWTMFSLVLLFADRRARVRHKGELDYAAQMCGERTTMHPVEPWPFLAANMRNPAMIVTAIAVLPGVLVVLMLKSVRRALKGNVPSVPYPA